MSRIGKIAVVIPKGVEIKVEGNLVSVKGPKGELKKEFKKDITVSVDHGKVVFAKTKNDKVTGTLFGLTRTMVQNMVLGVVQGYSKTLTLIGVGYRAAPKGKGVTFTLGYSHPIDFDPPAGIQLVVDKQTTVVVSGSDKELVGRVSDTIRSFRKPEPYHGKGVRYSDEVIQTKVGKAAGKK